MLHRWRSFDGAQMLFLALLLVIGGAFFYGAARSRLRHVQALTAEAMAAPTAIPQDPKIQAGHRLALAEAQLPAAEALPQQLADLFELAEHEGLKLERGEYSAQPSDAGAFLRHRMSLPLRGDAMAIERFLQTAQDRLPALRIESVELRRERADSAQIEARLQGALLTRLPKAPASSLAAPSAEAQEEQKERAPLFASTLPAPPPPPPPPPPALPAAPAPPAPPPLPFRYIGQMRLGSRTLVFLQDAQETWIAEVGATLAGAWKVERIEATQADFRYLPLDQVQVLRWPASD